MADYSGGVDTLVPPELTLCVNCFPCCCGQTQEKQRLKEQRFTSAHVLRGCGSSWTASATVVAAGEGGLLAHISGDQEVMQARVHEAQGQAIRDLLALAGPHFSKVSEPS